MTQSITVDTSGISDGQQIDAADVTTPIGDLKTAVENILNGAQGIEQELLVEISTPSNPASGKHKLYIKSDGLLYTLTSGGSEKQILNEDDIVAQTYPTRGLHWHHDSIVTVGNALEFDIRANQFANGIARQSSASDGDTFTLSMLLAAGTYTLYVLGMTAITGAKIDWYVDDVLVGSGQDWYSGSNVYNVEKTVTSITISEGGKHVIKGVVNGRNVSNTTGWYIALTTVSMRQASD